MAESSNTGILSKVGIGATDIDANSTENLPGSIWQSFKSVWSNNFSRIVFLSIFSMIFVAPAVAWVFVAVTFATNVASTVPYNLFDFMGYVSPTSATEGLLTAQIIGSMEYFKNMMFEFSVLIPLVGIASIGLGALAYTARLIIHKDDQHIFRDFFIGIRYTWLPSLVTGTVAGAALFLVVFCLFSFDAYGLPVVGKVFALIGSILLFVFVLLVAMYAISLSATYRMKLGKLLKDSVMFAIGCPIKNLIWVGIMAVIVGVCVLFKLFIPNFYLAIWVAIFMIGTYFIVSLFYTLAHSSFDTYINDQGSVRAMDAAKQKEMAARERNRQERLASKAAGEKPKKKQQQNVKFVNPKKKKKDGGVQEKPAEEEKKQVKGGYTAEELRQMELDREAAINKGSDLNDDFDASAYEDE